MLFKNLQINALLLYLLLINNLISCMEKKDTEIYHLDEQNLSPIETIPNELLLLIFYSKIDAIINSNDAHQGREEFKTFLSALRLTNRRFHSFGDELKKYFGMHKKLEVSDVLANDTTEPYTLSFKVGTKIYNTEVDNEEVNIEFLNKISSLDNVAISKIGEAIVQQVKTLGDAHRERMVLQFIFSELLYEPYDIAKDENDKEAMKKLREIIKPIFKAYPDKLNSIYVNNWIKFGLTDTD